MWCCRAGDGGSTGCLCAKPRVLVWWFWVVEVAVLALPRKIITILFDSSIWCGKHSTTLLHPNKFKFDFLIYLPPVPPPLTNSQHLGSFYLQVCITCAQLFITLQVKANHFLANCRSRRMLFCWLRKCVLCSVDHPKAEDSQIRERKEAKPWRGGFELLVWQWACRLSSYLVNCVPVSC